MLLINSYIIHTLLIELSAEYLIDHSMTYAINKIP